MRSNAWERNGWGGKWEMENGKSRGKAMSKANGIHRKPQRRNEKQTVRPAFLAASLLLPCFVFIYCIRMYVCTLSWQSKDLVESEILNGI